MISIPLNVYNLKEVSQRHDLDHGGPFWMHLYRHKTVTDNQNCVLMRHKFRHR